MKRLKQLCLRAFWPRPCWCALPARAQATGENYVEVAMTISPEYEAQGHGAAGAQRWRNRQ